MGFHVSWINARGKSPDEILSELGLVETPNREFIPESDVTAVALPSGWYTIFFNDPLPPELSDETLKKLSKGAEVMAFVVEETSMVSLARGYAGGSRSWEIVHDSSKGLKHLDVSGAPPECYAEVRNRLVDLLEAEKHSVDYLFDLPAELSKAVAGFRHDEDVEGVEGDPFSVLTRT